MSGRADYEERRQARIDRMNAASEKAAKESEQKSRIAHDLVKEIPFGQPNISGRDDLPRLREKSWNAMKQSIRLDEKANYYAGKAVAAEENNAISSDDPEAIAKLKAKIAELEAERERVKAFNKEARKNGTEPAAWYTLPYLSRNIKAAKERIAQLERVEVMPAEIIAFDGGEIESDPETNRVIIRFDERQSVEVTDRLKSRGFRWSPTNKGWQRLRNMLALRIACELCGVDNREQKWNRL